MLRAALFVLIPICLVGPVLAAQTVAVSPDSVAISDTGFRAELSLRDGALLGIYAPGTNLPVFRSGEHGLWRVRFRDGSYLAAGEFSADNAARRFSFDTTPEGAVLHYRSAALSVDVSVTAAARRLDLRATLRPAEKDVLELDLPGRLRFDPVQVNRFVMPMNGNSSVGSALNSRFFSALPMDDPAGWTHQPSGPQGYEALYGGHPVMREDGDPPTALSVTEAGRQWLPESVVARVHGAQAPVNRPPTREQAPLVLVDSANGPLLSANPLGGAGNLWRIGGAVWQNETGISQALISAVIDRLFAQPHEGRTKLGLISLRNGPPSGGWSEVPVAEWEARLSGSRAVLTDGAELVLLGSPAEMLSAAGSGEFLAILNPYGEWAPVTEEGGMPRTVEAVRGFVQSGGNWFEVGGYPFYYGMVPQRYLSMGTTYPAAFADFMHLDSKVGVACVYGVQPQVYEPWAGAANHDAVFVPGRLGCGADETGGHCTRSFAPFVAAGQEWTSPAARISVGGPVLDAVREYCLANAITAGLEDKMSPELLAKFRQAPLLYYWGNCAQKLAHLDRLPVPTLSHFADYLKGGFDKQYPDHLPPHPEFGTQEEFARFVARARELGHLVSPYTNPTWWCYDPKGPTFEREGDAPLLKNLDGALSHERYGSNPGYTVCHWHPAVQAANRKTVTQFTEEIPVDVLFQDQCGARGWHYDTNPASPTPYAYSDGLISQVAEDCRRAPLSTEAGWDRVVNYESQLCGMSFSIVPTEDGPAWRTLMKHTTPPSTWEVFPLAQAIAHDKCAMIHHDLGQFVTNREVLSWTLGLGFSMSLRAAASAVGQDATAGWIAWIDRIQKSICARYVGEPLVSFDHDRGPNPTVANDGVMRAQYGPVRVLANLGPEQVTVEGRELAGFGFLATAPGMVAANLRSLDGIDYGPEGISFVTETAGGRTRAYVYAPQRTEARVLHPDVVETVAVRCGERPGQTVTMPPENLAGKAPMGWPTKPAIGVIDLGEGIGVSWTKLAPGDWMRALEGSALCKEQGIIVRRVATAQELLDALGQGAAHWLAIINPYGETFPAVGPDRWQETLTAIREYVRNGGNWWETGGYSFYGAAYRADGKWDRQAVGPGGTGFLGLPVGGGEVDAPEEPLYVTDAGRAWLGEDLAERVAKLRSAVNRGLPAGTGDLGHTALVKGRATDFIGAYRFNGWGRLWRIGGFYPNPQVALPVTLAALEHLYTAPPTADQPAGIKYLWEFELL